MPNALSLYISFCSFCYFKVFISSKHLKRVVRESVSVSPYVTLCESDRISQLFQQTYFVCVSLCLCVFVCLCVCLFVSVYIVMSNYFCLLNFHYLIKHILCVFVFMCMYACVCVYVYVCVCVCIALHSITLCLRGGIVSQSEDNNSACIHSSLLCTGSRKNRRKLSL